MVKVDLVQVIEEEGYTVEDKGNYFSCLCPLHGDTSPSFIIYKSNPHRFICFGCNECGDAIDFIRHLKGMNYPQAIKYLDLQFSTSTRVALRKSMIEIVAEEEKNGVDVKKKYGKTFVDSLLMKELIDEATAE